MTPAFEHHDKIASLRPGAWLRTTAPVAAIVKNDRTRLTIGTVLRVVGECIDGSRYGLLFEFDAGGHVRTCRIEPEWFCGLEIVETPDEA